MKAWTLRAHGQDLSLDEVEDLRAGPGEAIVRLRAAALNHRDVWLQQGSYFITKVPVTLGADGAGVVCEVGAGVSREWLDAEVVINPAIGWGDSEAFAVDHFRTLGTPDNGTFATHIRIPAGQLCRKPEHLTFLQAAALPLSGLTGYRALFSRGGLKEGEAVLITGIGGGVAQFMLQYAVAAGAKVYVTSGSPDKIERARELGAIDGAVYRDEGWDARLKDQVPRGFDLIVDSACGKEFPKFVELATPGGRIVYFGLTAGPSPALDMRNFYRKQLSLLGTKMGSPRDFSAMIEFVSRHKIIPSIDTVYDFTEINTAIKSLDSGGHYGKIAFNIA